MDRTEDIKGVSSNSGTLRRIRRKLDHSLIRPVHKLWYGDNGIHVMEEDWDNLIILDACREDTFRSISDINSYDSYRQVQSLGAHTAQWANRNFAEKSFGDTVFITATPMVTNQVPDSFHKMINLWEEDGYDPDFAYRGQTISPDYVNQRTKEVSEKYPNKRLIIQYLQPHHPFIGEKELPEKVYTDAEHPWDALKKGLVDETSVREAYRANLELVLPFAKELSRDLTGKSVISSDHGNLFGEYVFPYPVRIYGHPASFCNPGLTAVPWAVVDGDSRREIRDDGIHSATGNREKINQQLEALGYK